ncbi:hypothetical protein OC844_003166 [Tilletia horrida]|nr:hypothetical protein OC844_003166 [Tilletia horrida]
MSSPQTTHPQLPAQGGAAAQHGDLPQESRQEAAPELPQEKQIPPPVVAGPGTAAAPPEPVLDIEHQLVEDDPRLWSSRQKAICVFTLMLGALSPTLGASIFFPALQSLQDQLNATTASISLAVSLYILFQGTVPLVWSSISELIGRKIIFIAGSIIFAVTSLICGLANSMTLLIVMRCLSAGGSSPMLSIGAGTLADMYYSAPLLGPAISPIIGGALTEADSWRATFYFLAAAGVAMIVSFTFLFKETFRPARSLAWTQARERALRRAEVQRKEDELHPEKAIKRKAEQAKREAHPPLHVRLVRSLGHFLSSVQLRLRRVKKAVSAIGRTRQSSTDAGLAAASAPPVSDQSSEATVLDLPTGADAAAPGPHRREAPDEPFEPPRFFEPVSPRAGADSTHELSPAAAKVAIAPSPERAVRDKSETHAEQGLKQGQGQGGTLTHSMSRGRMSRGVSRTESRRSVLSRTMTNRVVTATGEEITFKPSFADVNPLRPLLSVLSEPHNIVSLISSGLSFGSYYSLTLTLTRSLSSPPGSANGGYGFSPIIVGCVLLCVGGGGMIGSILGGRLSDRRLRKIKSGALVSPLVSPTSVEAAAWGKKREREKEGRGDVEAEGGERAPKIVVEPEERIVSAAIPMLCVPFCWAAYGWAVKYSINIAAVCVILFLLGVAQFTVYAATLSYVVDSNKGRGSSAVACNSAFRGSVAFVASEIALRLLAAMGNGWLYTGWAIALGVTQLALFFVAFQGPRWRREGFRRQQDWRFLRPRNWRA